MTSILCLAHYCDTHGPTPLMVTEGFAVACQYCNDEDHQKSERRPSTSSKSTKKSEVLDKTKQVFTRTKSVSSDKENDTQKTTQPNTPRLDFSSSALETPPDSPRLATLSITRSNHRRDSSFRKTYDENDRKRAVPCENCALTLPKKVKEQIPEGAPGSPMKSGKGDNGSPVLRTRKAYERISTLADNASAKSTPSDSDDSERSQPATPRILQRTTTSSSVSSFASSNSHTHNHYLDYTSTHDPLSSASFSVLRASCLRTLSCETLPPSATTSPQTPTSPTSYSPYRTLSSSSTSPAAAASGGPIFFGDPLAGYTTAYIFRVPDPHARGRRRVYAFICLSSARERAAMRAFSFLAAAFRDLAAWIQSLAEAEADRLESETPASLATGADRSVHERSSTPSGSLKQYSSSARAPAAESSSPGTPKLSFTPTSAFLAGRPANFDSDGFPRKGYGLMGGGIRSRGLAELVGRPDFFIELHAHFVRLLAQLSVLFAGGAA